MMKNTLQNVTGKAKGSQGPPRLDPYQRLLARFYEPLVLLQVLDRNGERKRSHCPSLDAAESQLDPRDLRRKFLDQLAYVCDQAKGGDFVTAIALEAQVSGVAYWVASNSTISNRKVLFLESILEALKSLSIPQTVHSRSLTADQILRSCIKFNRKRIHDYRVLMRKPLESCLKLLQDSNTVEDKALATWLKKFQGFENDEESLCRFSYEQRASYYLKDLQRHIGDEVSELTESESTRQTFLLTRHYIGRLGSHLKAVKILVATGIRIPSLFENYSIKIGSCSKPPSLPPPTDRKTTLEGILRRMLPAGSEEYPRYQELLASMDSKFKLQDRLMAQYKDQDFKPRVHAELILLELFYASRRPFVGNDRFIGCSKPACYCCYHYISLHPGGFVRPPSHGVRYISWRPPDLIHPKSKVEMDLQRDVMNSLIAQIRRDTLRHIDERKGPSPWHPDSTTGITYSQMLDGSVVQEFDNSSTIESLPPEEEVSDYSDDGDSLGFINLDDNSDIEGGASL